MMVPVVAHDGFIETEIGLIPKEWPLVSIKELSEILKAGGTPRRGEKSYWGGSIPFVKIGDVTSSQKYLESTDETITEQGMDASSAWQVPPGSVLLTMYGTIGEVAISKIPAATNQAIITIVPKAQVRSDYLYYALKYYGRHLVKYNIQSTQKNINKGIVERFSIPLPPLPEQRRIAHVLSTIQNAIAAQDDVISAARELKRSMMHRLFTYGPSENPMPTKETEVGLLPDHWKVVKIGEITISSAFGPRFSGKLYDEDGNVATLRTTDLDDDGKIGYETMPRARINEEKYGKHFLQPGDFLVTRSGTCGIAAIFDSYSTPVLPGAFLIRLRLDEAKSYPQFLREYLNSDIGRSRIQRIATGAVQKNISGTRLKAFRIPLPPVAEQRKIARLLRRANEKIQAEERRKAALEEIFRSMLHELMTGRLRTHNLELPDDLAL